MDASDCATEAGQCHCNFSSNFGGYGKWWKSLMTGKVLKDGQDRGFRKPQQVSLPSRTGKIMFQILLEVMSRQMKEKKVTGNCQHGFIMKSYLWCLQWSNMIFLNRRQTCLKGVRSKDGCPKGTIYFSKILTDITINIFTMKALKCWNRSPERLWNLHSCGYSKLNKSLSNQIYHFSPCVSGRLNWDSWPEIPANLEVQSPSPWIG